ncbi:M14 family metallocarboxypeptidase [Bacillus sp. J37]|uniref:M14 family metallopeptidase n=1 Tax=Bacillus sp. J37 TaxID=935837 RepID=UPI0004B1C288|nr:M14 family metallocarboxypeptidase [Bacillus sp. J37]
MLRNKIFHSFLAVILLLSCFPFSVFAETNDEKQQSEWITLIALKDTAIVDDSEKPLFTIKEDAIFYGFIKEETTFINWNDTFFEVANEAVKEVDNGEVSDENFPTLSMDEQAGENVRTLENTVLVYSESNRDSEVVAEINKGTAVDVVAVNDEYVSVLIGNRTGYIFVSDLEVLPEENNSTSQLEHDETKKTEESVVEEDQATEEEADAEVEVEVPKAEESSKEAASTTSDDKIETVKISSFTSETKYFEITSDTTIYVKSGKDLVKAGEMLKGQAFQRIRDYGNWHEIKYGDQLAYVWKETTVPSKKGKLIFNSSNLKKETFKVVKAATVYDNQSGKLIPIINMEKGIDFPILSDYGNWFKIDVAGRIAYIHKDNVDINITSSDYFQVIEDDLTLYRKTGSKLVRVATLEEGTIFTRKRDYGNWHEVQIGNQVGYIWKKSTKYVLKKPKNINTSYKSSGEQIKVIQGSTVYDNSGGTLKEIGQLDKGVTYDILSRYGKWYRIELSGVVGYVYHSTVEEVFTSKTQYFEATEDVAVYDNLNGKLVQVGNLIQGQHYKRVSDYGNWHKIQFSDHFGYVYKSSTKPSSGSGIKNKATSNGVYGFATPRNDVIVYDNTSKNLVPFGELKKGVKYTVESPYGKWLKVNYAGRYGYIQKDQVDLKVQNVLKPKNIVDPMQTYTYETMVKDLKEIEKSYPGLAKLTSIGKSVDGRELYALKLGKGKTEILIHGSHHAREWITTNLVMEKIDQYAYLYATNGKMDVYNVKEVLNNTTIWFVPMVNPDGVTLVQKGHTSAKNPNNVLKINGGSKDFSAWKANIRGVDLNRQYPANWNNIVGNTGKPSPDNYKGPKPLSEPESSAMVDFANQHDFKTAVSYHSSGQIIYWQFNQTGERLKRDQKIANTVSKKTGYSLVPIKKNPSGGGFNDWFLTYKKNPGFTPELSPYVGPRPVPLRNFNKIWKENNSLGLILAKEAFENRNNR